MKTKLVERIYGNIQNGNLSDAKRLAKRISMAELVVLLIGERGLSSNRAYATMMYLKDKISFQDYLKAE